MIQLLIDLMQLETQFLGKLEKIFREYPFAFSAASHVEETEHRNLKRIALIRFGRLGTVTEIGVLPFQAHALKFVVISC